MRGSLSLLTPLFACFLCLVMGDYAITKLCGPSARLLLEINMLMTTTNPTLIITVDGVHCCVNEPKHPTLSKKPQHYSSRLTQVQPSRCWLQAWTLCLRESFCLDEWSLPGCRIRHTNFAWSLQVEIEIQRKLPACCISEAYRSRTVTTKDAYLSRYEEQQHAFVIPLTHHTYCRKLFLLLPLPASVCVPVGPGHTLDHHTACCCLCVLVSACLLVLAFPSLLCNSHKSFTQW
jgi:hypothetical protein